ncbi:hypothetical protein [Patulibacter sp. SYSU D01012]|uniref:hypothetical protein n=1 Tax=Patulibacter sp. SYSU D01012 TaxID=2817381 RepID=UPI001B315FE1|nr:hypothetical protein [Patulibacter sp. SYSU D01012]
MHLAHYLTLLQTAERDLADALRAVADAHADEPAVRDTARLTAAWATEHARRLEPFCDRYAPLAPGPPEELHVDLFRGPRTGGLAYLRDLHDLFLQASTCDITWTLVGQAAKGTRDEELVAAVEACEGETARTLAWLKTLMKTSATQALVVA